MRHSLRVLIKKEIADHIHSWRFNILLALIFLTALASIYTAGMAIRDAVSKADTPLGDLYLFLKVFTVSDGRLPSFITFVGFLAPLLGIGMAFDAINGEINRRTLVRLIAQPIYRDDVILSKWIAALLVITVFFLALGFFVMGLAILFFGIPPTFEEVMRIIVFLLATALYVGVWLSLGILFSIYFRQPATSLLASIAVWLFFALFYDMIVNILVPIDTEGPAQIVFRQMQIHQYLLRISPTTLYQEVVTTLLSPNVRSLGPLTVAQVVGAIPTPLSFDQSLLLIWPQIVGLVALSVFLFAISFTLFMRQDIRH
ncbi:ABC transporter permease [Caldanaerobacter subterraneus]|uniref:ABC transporter permease n=1 Tax=Caldanaerobacter subterraneus TaxID=911092 RepID=A0A7Y2L776_9THEO|nr:ABC transporter permease subunit [Caldanaerobacter subterraneus]NNG67064.1 ABC transporter permease [Caldanaerobacter subterraneus]